MFWASTSSFTTVSEKGNFEPGPACYQSGKVLPKRVSCLKLSFLKLLNGNSINEMQHLSI
jgi:hypothetical protein